jgi:hypothetical protein
MRAGENSPSKVQINGVSLLSAQILRFALEFFCKHRQSIANGTVLERVGELSVTLGVLPENSFRHSDTLAVLPP